MNMIGTSCSLYGLFEDSSQQAEAPPPLSSGPGFWLFSGIWSSVSAGCITIAKYMEFHRRIVRKSPSTPKMVLAFSLAPSIGFLPYSVGEVIQDRSRHRILQETRMLRLIEFHGASEDLEKRRRLLF